jgi:hypothetical protein
MNVIAQLKRAARFRDAKLAGQAVDALRMAGLDYRACYRLALAGDPSLTEGEWEDLMAEADEG